MSLGTTIVGSILIIGGLISLFSNRREAEESASYWRKALARFPWLAKLPNTRGSDSEESWELMAPVTGIMLIIVGVLFMFFS